jgi:hypothetical protein
VRGDDILLDERGRDLEGRGDVVEAAGDLVGRQQGGGVDFHREQVADGVLVLAAVQPVEHELIRNVLVARVRVERVLEPGDELVDVGAIGLRLAGRRHDAGAELAHGLLVFFGVRRDALGRQAVEAQFRREIDVVVAVEAEAAHRCHRGFGVGLRAAAGERAAECGDGGDGEQAAGGFQMHRFRRPV